MTTANSAPIDAGLLGTDRRPGPAQARIGGTANDPTGLTTLFRSRNLSDGGLAGVGNRRDPITSAAQFAHS